MKHLHLTSEELVKEASARLDDLRKSLPDDTRGTFVLGLMLRMLHDALPAMQGWALSDQFTEALVLWLMLGSPDYDVDDDKLSPAMREVMSNKWVH